MLWYSNNHCRILEIINIWIYTIVLNSLLEQLRLGKQDRPILSNMDFYHECSTCWKIKELSSVKTRLLISVMAIALINISRKLQKWYLYLIYPPKTEAGLSWKRRCLCFLFHLSCFLCFIFIWHAIVI